MRKVKEPKTKVIRVRMSEKEYADLMNRLEKCGMNAADFIRHAVAGKKIVSRVDSNLINQFSKLGGLLKKVHSDSHGAYSDLTRDAIQALTQAARTLIRSFNDR